MDRDTERQIIESIAVLLGVCVIAAVALAIVYIAVMTGPNCPGMDPDWIGWCLSDPTASE